ncbi:MAG: 3D domain-containing protein [Clostridia bacterium]
MTAHHDNKMKYKIIRYTVMGLIVLMACTFFTCYLFESNLKDVVINYNGYVYGTRTLDNTYEDFINSNNIFVDSRVDFINVPLEQPLENGNVNEIMIKSAVPVTIFHDKEEKRVMTFRETVGEVLEEFLIPIYDRDYIVGLSTESQVVNNMAIQVVRVTKGVEIQKTAIPFFLTLEENPNMAINETVVSRVGEPGENCVIYEITYEDGREVRRKVIFDEVIKQSVNQVVEYGTIPVMRIPGTDEYFKYLSVKNMVATAYTLCPTETGGKEPGHPAYGITFSGIPAERGVIAVDPSVIPLGTKVYIESLDKRFPDYGIAIAGDTGSAIIGNRIDLFMDEKAEALRWGIRTVRVYIIYEE